MIVPQKPTFFLCLPATFFFLTNRICTCNSRCVTSKMNRAYVLAHQRVSGEWLALKLSTWVH